MEGKEAPDITSGTCSENKALGRHFTASASDMRSKRRTSCMKIKRGTTYNQKVMPFIKENMNSWVPPTFQAMTLWPVFAGDSKYAEGYWVNHNHFENLDIQLIQEGNLKIYHDGTTALLNPGELAVIPFGSHKLETGPAGYCVKKCIGFSGMALKILVKTLELDSFFVIPDFLSLKIIELHERICRLLNEKNPDSVSELSILAYAFLMQIATSRRTTAMPPALIASRHFIEQNIFQKLTLEDISQEAKCSKATLTRLFKKHLNMTPIQFLISQRINYAKNLLQNKSMPIKEIATLCGYQNQLYFSNDFRKHTGLSPREFCRR